MDTLINFVFEYGLTMLAIFALLATLIGVVVKYLKYPNSKQVQIIKKWLIVACIEAEKEMKSKTGQLKLLVVYKLFTDKFTWMSKLISFEMFSNLVDEALVTVRHMIETNPKVKEYVEQ